MKGVRGVGEAYHGERGAGYMVSWFSGEKRVVSRISRRSGGLGFLCVDKAKRGEEKQPVRRRGGKKFISASEMLS